MNKTILLGRITKDIELKMTPQGTSVCRFSIAVQRRFKDADGNYPTDFISCTAWRQTAEFICKYFKKGNMIAVVGSIQTNVWEKDGKKQYSTEVVVDEVSFTGDKKENAKADEVTEDMFDTFELVNDEDMPF